MVPVPVPEKFGPGKKYRSRYRKNLVPEKSTGPGTGKNSGYRHTLSWISASTPVRSTGSTRPTAKRFLIDQAKIFGKQQYLQCAKLIKETLDSRYRIVLFAMIS